MSTLVAIVVVLFAVGMLIAYNLGLQAGRGEGYDSGFHDGKREGAKRGYAVGFDRGKHQRDPPREDDAESPPARSGCLPILLLLTLAGVIASVIANISVAGL